MQHHRLLHQAIELTEELVDLIEGRLRFDQLLDVLAKTGRHKAIDVQLFLQILVDDLVAAGGQCDVVFLRGKLDDTIVRAVIDHLHGDAPFPAARFTVKP
ncbi:protein of unknown function [Pararobbsia alpina]